MRFPHAIVVAAAVSMACAGVASPLRADGTRILFIGNSLTATNGLPAMVEAIGASAGERVECTSVVYPDFSLEDHWTRGDARRAIQRGGWSFVVLQQGPSARPDSRVLLRDYVRRFHREIVAAAERRRIERDIHDGAQHELVSLAVRLTAAQELVLAGDRRASGAIIESRAALDRCIDELRELGRGIFPPVLAARGLASALRARARSSPEEVHLVVAEESEGARVDPGVELAVYFCCTEALQNAAKHAAGARVVVHLEVTETELRFDVADEGPGLADVPQAGEGTGLVGMQDRLGAVGGVLTVTSSPGRGTTISGRVPLRS